MSKNQAWTYFKHHYRGSTRLYYNVYELWVDITHGGTVLAWALESCYELALATLGVPSSAHAKPKSLAYALMEFSISLLFIVTLPIDYLIRFPLRLATTTFFIIQALFYDASNVWEHAIFSEFTGLSASTISNETHVTQCVKSFIALQHHGHLPQHIARELIQLSNEERNEFHSHLSAKRTWHFVSKARSIFPYAVSPEKFEKLLKSLQHDAEPDSTVFEEQVSDIPNNLPQTAAPTNLPMFIGEDITPSEAHKLIDGLKSNTLRRVSFRHTGVLGLYQDIHLLNEIYVSFAQNTSLEEFSVNGSFLEMDLCRLLTSFENNHSLKTLMINNISAMYITDELIQSIIQLVLNEPKTLKEITLMNLSYQGVSQASLHQLVTVCKQYNILFSVPEEYTPPAFITSKAPTPTKKKIPVQPLSDWYQKTPPNQPNQIYCMPATLMDTSKSPQPADEINSVIRLQRHVRAFFKRRQHHFSSQGQLTELQSKFTTTINTNPLVPSKRHEPVNETDKQNFLKLINPIYYDVMSKVLSDHMHHITFEELVSSLHRCVNQLNQFVAQNPDLWDITITKAPNKSQSWVANLAASYMSFRPTRVVEAHHFELMDNALKDFSHSPHRKALMIFDDVSYTGTQLTEIINRHFRKKNDITFTSPVDVIFIIPFMTNRARKKMANISQIYESPDVFNGLVKIHLITDTIIPSIADLPLSENELKLLQLLNGGDYVTKKTLVTTDWKIPDYVSFLYVLSNFTMITGDYNKSVTTVNVIPEIHPPYSKVYDDECNDTPGLNLSK